MNKKSQMHGCLCERFSLRQKRFIGLRARAEVTSRPTMTMSGTAIGVIRPVST